MEIDDKIKLDILYKRYNRKSSTSIRKNYFEEREAPESLYPVFSYLQLYSQSHHITSDVPSDLADLTDTDLDDSTSALAGSYVGKASQIVPVLRRYLKVPLVRVPSPCGKAFQAPKCLTVVNASQFEVGEIITGQVSGARGSIVAIRDTFLFFKSLCGIQVDFQANELVQGRTSNFSSTVLEHNRKCPMSQVLRHVIPFDFGRGGYAYRLYKNDGTEIFFGQGNWLLDTFSGVLTFYGAVPQGITDLAPPSLSFFRYIGKIGLNTSHTLDGNVGIGTENPRVSLDIDTRDAIRVPYGTTAERPDPPLPGYVRYNTDIESLEVYDCCLWLDLSKGLGGDSSDVNIATGGSSRTVNIGNTIGTSGVNVASGAGDIVLSSGNNISLDANSNISLHTRAPNGPSTITLGNHDPNLTILLQADGPNSKIELNGPVNLTNLSQITVSGAYNYGTGNSDGDWRTLQNVNPNDSSSTTLLLQKLIAGTWITRHRFD